MKYFATLTLALLATLCLQHTSYADNYIHAYKSEAQINDYFSDDLTAASTVTTDKCGATLFLNATTEFATTLPAPSAGCSFKFVVKAAPSGASYTIVTTSSANIFIGSVVSADLNAASDGDASTADDTITIADGVAVVGDVVEMVSDGTSWYYIGYAKTFNGITAAQAS